MPEIKFSKNLAKSKLAYDKLHQIAGFQDEAEGYEILGSFLKGNTSVDIGCGYGFIQRYSPNTVAVDFSKQALKIAQKNGAKKIVKAYAEKLPFKNNEFKIALSLGVLEHCSDQKQAIKEMIRVSKIQILVVHAKLPYGLELIRKPIIKLFGLKDQPIEKPLTRDKVEKLLNTYGSKVLVRGIWNYIDLRWLWRRLPYGIVKWPSHHFIVSIKSPNLKRKFLGDKQVNPMAGQKMYSNLFYNQFFKKLGLHLLSSPWFVNNFIYQKIQNYYINKIITTYQQAPNIVFIENTNFCNFKCKLCPHDIMKRKTGVMPFSLFKKIIDQCLVLGVKKVSIHGFGEPLIDKNFIDKIKYAKKRGLTHVGTSSNASLLNRKIALAIINSGLDEINFSLDALYSETYARVRSPQHYKQVMANIHRFVAMRNQLGKTKPIVVVDLIESDLNRSEVNDFVNFWSKIADRVNITTPHSWGGKLKKRVGRRSFHTKRHNIKRNPCRFLWTDMYINWNGQVVACCQDYEAKMIVGNIKVKNLAKIWQGRKLNKLRQLHLQKKFYRLPICVNCDYRSVWWLFK